MMSKSIATILEQDRAYFDYFKNAVHSGTNYFEYEFVLGDSASATLFYIKKSECENANEALVKLTISFRYYQGFFRQSNSKSIESIFEVVKDDMRLDIYWNTEFKDVGEERLLEDLKIFPVFGDNKIRHFEYAGEGKYLESKREISEFLNECKSYSSIKLTEWNPSYEYFIVTENYYLLFNFSTGA